MYMLDTSAYMQGLLNAPARQRLSDLLRANQVATCATVMLEVLFTARNTSTWREMREEFTLMSRRELSDPITAVDLQGALARRGQHRTPIVDILVAATAAEHGLTVLHYDRDFERLSELTGGTHEWVVPAGAGH
jgi:predicted nucleic acid-binding protein